MGFFSAGLKSNMRAGWGNRSMTFDKKLELSAEFFRSVATAAKVRSPRAWRPASGEEVRTISHGLGRPGLGRTLLESLATQRMALPGFGALSSSVLGTIMG